MTQASQQQPGTLTPSTAGAEYIGVFTQLFPHSVPPFNHGKAIM